MIHAAELHPLPPSRADERRLMFMVDGQTFGGRVSATGFAFTPRLISRGDLRRIHERFSKAVRLHDSPEATSPAQQISLGPNAPFKYWVEDVKGTWMKLNAGEGGPRGWVQADVPLEEWSLRRQLPELIFVEGVAGYLSTRVTRANPTALPLRRSRASEALQRALDAFRATDSARAPQVPLAEAVGRQLIGLLQLPPEPTATTLEPAVKAFADALERMPNDAEARNLTATARLYRGLRAADLSRNPRRTCRSTWKSPRSIRRMSRSSATWRACWNCCCARPPARVRCSVPWSSRRLTFKSDSPPFAR